MLKEIVLKDYGHRIAQREIAGGGKLPFYSNLVGETATD